MKVKIQLSASPAFLDAILQLAQAFGGLQVSANAATVATAGLAEKATRNSKKATEKVIAPVIEKVETAPDKVETIEKVEVVEKVEVEKSTETAPESITIEDLRTIIRDKAQAGKREALKAILAEFDVTNVTLLDASNYVSFKAKAEAL